MSAQRRDARGALRPAADHADCAEFLQGVMTTAQFEQLSNALAERKITLRGAALLAFGEAELRGLGVHHKTAQKVAAALRAAAAAAGGGASGADDDAEADDDLTEDEGGDNTPMVADVVGLAPEQLALTGAGPSGAAPAGGAKRGRAAALAAAAAARGRLSGAADAEALAGRKRAAPRRAAGRMAGAAVKREPGAEAAEEEAEQYAPPSGADSSDEDDAGAATEDEAPRRASRGAAARGAAAAAARRRAPPPPRAAGAAAAASSSEDGWSGSDEEDDGVHPRNGANWAAAREGLEDILRRVPVPALVALVEEEFDAEDKMYRHKVFDVATHTRVWRTKGAAAIARNVVKMKLDGQLKAGALDGGSTWEAADELLRFAPDAAVKAYLKGNLRKQFAALPRIRDPRALVWRLWSRPVGGGGPRSVALGSITLRCACVGKTLRDEWEGTVERAARDGKAPTFSLGKIAAALRSADESGDEGADADAGPGRVKAEVKGEGGGAQAELVLAPDDGGADGDARDIVASVQALASRAGAAGATAALDLAARTLRLDLFVRTGGTRDGVELPASSGTVHGAWRRRGADGVHAVTQIDVGALAARLDHVRGDAALEELLDAFGTEWDATIDGLERIGVASALSAATPLSFAHFDALMTQVEDKPRPMAAGIEAACADNLKLRLTPYQLRALSFMLGEERTAGGTARHLWARLPLPPGQAGAAAWVSPSLFQIHVATSRIAAEQRLGTAGGSGWQALEMGMGKTAVVIATIALNPAPAGWRAPRTWARHDPADYEATVAGNMPRGGTLVVVPATIVRQWELEIEKTLKAPGELSVLRWLDAGRALDCAAIAAADVVITTPAIATKTAHLAQIFWHRVVVDEAQLSCGAVLRGGFFSTHRWIVSGTPANQAVDSLAPSLEFLRLGGFHDAQNYLPPALGVVLRAAMCRYTKGGTVDGAVNLELPPLSERVVECALVGDDRKWYRKTQRELFEKTLSHLRAGIARSTSKEMTVPELLAQPAVLHQLCEEKKVNSKRVRGYAGAARSTCGGATGVRTGEVGPYNPRRGATEIVEHRCCGSKADAVVAELVRIRAADPAAKVLVFSEYAETLHAVQARLPALGLDHRVVISNTSHKKRGEAIEAFMSDPPTRVFLLGAKAGAVGITLTAASVVLICEPLLNPALELQAVGRARRMGQTKPTTVVRLFLKDSVEERLRAWLARAAPPSAARSTILQCNDDATELKLKIGVVHELLECGLESSDDEDEGGAGGDSEVNLVSDDE